MYELLDNKCLSCWSDGRFDSMVIVYFVVNIHRSSPFRRPDVNATTVALMGKFCIVEKL